MRSMIVRLAGLAMMIAAVVVCFAGFGRESRGDTYYYTPTAYYVPATAALIGPAYEITAGPLLSTSFTSTTYIPTTYTTIPTSYATVYSTPTVLLEPTAYVRTYYERGLFRRRRWVIDRPLVAGYAETTYVIPSAYSTPRYRATVYDAPTVWESSYAVSTPICDDQVRPASRSSDAVEDKLDPIPPKASVASQPSGGEGSIPSKVGTPKPPVAKPPAAEVKSVPADTTPPVPTPAPREQSTVRPVTPPVTVKPLPDAKALTPPVAPADDKPGEIDLKPAPLGDDAGELRRDSLKPNYDASRPLAASRRGVLMGAVETNSGEAREDVRVSVTSQDRLDLAHNGVTNAFGRFAIRLEDGEWTVNVTLPSGRVHEVRRISVKGGRVIDRAENRDIPNLIISY